MRRLLSFGQAPTILDDIWLPGAVFRGLTAESLARYRGPLYALFESEFGVSMVRAEEKIKAVSATADQAAQLQVGQGDSLLQVERVRSEEHTSELESLLLRSSAVFCL